jgi:hypothetical protein
MDRGGSMKTLNYSILFVMFATTLFAQDLTLREISNQSDYIIITMPEFVKTCELFKDHKETIREINVLVVTDQQILGEFYDSESVQENIRDFISYAAKYWAEPKPEYFLFAASVDKIPNFQFVSIPNYPETDTSSSDYFYGINKLGEDTTEVSLFVGRVSVRDTIELSNYFEKVIQYESDPNVYGWNNTALFLADDGEPNGVGDIFEEMAFSISQETPEFIHSKFIFESENSTYFGTTDSVITFINNESASSLLFSGFGNNEQFTHEGFFTIGDVIKLQNTNKPLFTGFLFKQILSFSSKTSILDLLLFSQAGAIAGVAPVGTSFYVSGENMLTELWPQIYDGATLGEAFIDALNEGVVNNEKKKYCFFGDPSIILKSDPLADIRYSYSESPQNFHLHQNYPNPFNPYTHISFEIPQTGIVRLQVFDSLGRFLGDIINEEFIAGVHKVGFNGSTLSSGVYYYRLSYNQKSETRKMLLLR